MIKDFIASKKLTSLECDELVTRYNTYKSYKLVLDTTDNFPWNDIYNENFSLQELWLEGIIGTLKVLKPKELMMEQDNRIFSWNARGIKRQIGMLNFLNSYDLILLQETWLHKFEANLVDRVLPYHTVACKYLMSEDIISRGRPFGELLCAWKTQLNDKVTQVHFEEQGIQGLKISLKENCLYVINVYFPVNNDDNDLVISEYISAICAFCNNHDGKVIICGDFNLDPRTKKFLKA